MRGDPRPARPAAPSPPHGPLRPSSAHPLGERAWPVRASRASARGRSLAGCCRPLDAVAADARRARRSGSCWRSSAHAVGWPVARGGSQRLADALAAHLRSLGGEIETGRWVESLDELAGLGTVLLDVTPRQLLRARRGPAAGAATRARLAPLPLRARGLQARLGARRADPVDRAGGAPAPAPSTCGGTLDEIAASEDAAVRGRASRAAVRAARAAEPVRSRAARPRASTRPGPTATCRTARPAT